MIINNYSKAIHFIGIGGIGMSGIAELMLDQGYCIQGSDILLNDNIKRLQKKGINFYLGHKKSNVKNISAAVFSSAIKKNNPEILYCKKLSIPLVSRADMLAELMKDKNAIAIAGSHGKTTTTSLVGSILECANFDPTIINGGIINESSTNNRLGFSKWMVVEADESDESFLKLPHKINIVTNIDIEHLDYYKTDKKLFKSFENFITNIPFYGYSIICIDDKNSKRISKKIKTRKIITYGYKAEKADVKILKIKQNKSKTLFSIFINKKIIPKYSGIYHFKSNLLGVHNVLNATGAIISAFLIGAEITNVKKALYNFQGVKRRFTCIGKINKSLIIDDYAHHPTEIKASYEIAKQVAKKKIIILFQPHRFSRTKYLFNDFIKVLKKIDILYILDIYPAGEKTIKNINSLRLVNELKKYNKKVFYVGKRKNIEKILKLYFDEENLIIFMGAGSITYHAHKLISNKNV